MSTPELLEHSLLVEQVLSFLHFTFHGSPGLTWRVHVHYFAFAKKPAFCDTPRSATHTASFIMPMSAHAVRCAHAASHFTCAFAFDVFWCVKI